MLLALVVALVVVSCPLLSPLRWDRHWLLAAVVTWRVSFFGVCFVDALFVDGVSKSNVGCCFHHFHHSPSRFPPIGWPYVEAGCAVDVIISFKEDRCIRWALACTSFTTLSPLSTGWSLGWRVTAKRRSYEGWCEVQWSWRQRQVCCSTVALKLTIGGSFSAFVLTVFDLFASCTSLFSLLYPLYL